VTGSGLRARPERRYHPLEAALVRHREAAAVVVVALVALVLVTLALTRHEEFPGDRLAIPAQTGDQVAEPLRTIANAFAFLAEPAVAALTIAALALIVAVRIGRRDGLLVIVVAGALVINEIARRIIGPTPAEIAVGGTPVANFPSGHAVYAAAVFGLAAWLAFAHGHRAVAAGFAVVMVAMGPLRVLRGFHWPSDVVAGYALGYAWLITVLIVALPWAAAGRAGDRSWRADVYGR
jgi:membrane-associated phospholipid phosphatase